MVRIAALGSLIHLAGVVIPAAAQSSLLGLELPAAGGRPNVHSGVELLALNVVVTDRENHFIEGLGLGNCRVYEDGVRQELTFFSGDPTALDLVILLDVSSSMGNKMGFVRRAATDFVDVLRPIDRGAVLTFNQGLTVPQTLTDDRAAIKAAILGTRPHGETALYTTLYVTLRELTRGAELDTEARRRAIVVLSDGYDTGSVVGFGDVLSLARRAGVGIYTITLQPVERSIGGRGAKVAYAIAKGEFAMKTLARDTGALAFFAQRGAHTTPLPPTCRANTPWDMRRAISAARGRFAG